MSGKTTFDGTSPKTQSVDAVKSLLTWKGRAVDPLPSVVEFAHEGADSHLVLILSNKKDAYFVCTATKCSCPSQTYRGGTCRHQRKYFGARPEQVANIADSSGRPIVEEVA
jgi:hypothetical protein